VTSRVAQWWRADEPGAAVPRVVGAAVGDLAPDLVGLDSQGAPIHLSSHRGRVVVLNFWATWCGPCLAEIPLLNDLQARYGSQGVDVIGVSVDEGGWPVVAPFADKLKIAYPLALSNDEVAAAFGGLSEVPATFVIDREGRIVIKRVGVLSEEAAPLPIDRLIAR
jgi:cytochrome c biogenesis protein CcmG/thiol:disulfide interchange protein DsbE